MVTGTETQGEFTKISDKQQQAKCISQDNVSFLCAFIATGFFLHREMFGALTMDQSSSLPYYEPGKSLLY